MFDVSYFFTLFQVFSIVFCSLCRKMLRFFVKPIYIPSHIGASSYCCSLRTSSWDSVSFGSVYLSWSFFFEYVDVFICFASISHFFVFLEVMIVLYLLMTRFLFWSETLALTSVSPGAWIPLSGTQMLFSSVMYPKSYALFISLSNHALMSWYCIVFWKLLEK